MSRLVLGPFNRVEGDLEVTLETENGRVESAKVNSPLYRGFEQILQGKDPMDALAIAPRICGICSVSQSVASSLALSDAMGLEVPENGRIARNLVHACENLADHITHFYLFFMPDFARDGYSQKSWHERIAKRFQAVKGEAAGDVLPARAAFLRLMGLLAGKWPHSLSIQPGGSLRAIDRAEKMRIHAHLREFRRFLEDTLFGDSLESVASLGSAGSLFQLKGGDFAAFLEASKDLGLSRYGRATDSFMSYGNYPVGEGTLFPSGVWSGELLPLEPGTILEDVSHSWMEGETLHPSEGFTQPMADKEGAYSWCKAPRLGGRVVETGALARQVITGQPLVRELVSVSGGNVENRVIARLVETARVAIEMEKWALQLKPGEPFCSHGKMPQEAKGAGLVEAARGSLGHWIEVRRGRIHNYQIVSPTTWNFSPRDEKGVPGALEQALVGAPVDGNCVMVQHIVRSFDPCMVCTVH